MVSIGNGKIAAGVDSIIVCTIDAVVGVAIIVGVHKLLRGECNLGLVAIFKNCLSKLRGLLATPLSLARLTADCLR